MISGNNFVFNKTWFPLVVTMSWYKNFFFWQTYINIFLYLLFSSCHEIAKHDILYPFHFIYFARTRRKLTHSQWNKFELQMTKSIFAQMWNHKKKIQNPLFPIILGWNSWMKCPVEIFLASFITIQKYRETRREIK